MPPRKTTKVIPEIKQALTFKHSQLIGLDGKVDPGIIINHDKTVMDPLEADIKKLVASGVLPNKARLEKVLYSATQAYLETGRRPRWVYPLDELKPGEQFELVPWVILIRDPESNTLYAFSKGTNFWSTEIFNSTGFKSVGFNHDDRVPASKIFPGCDNGEVKKSTWDWLNSKYYCKGANGEKRTLSLSLLEQIDQYIPLGFESEPEFILVGHSAGTTIGNVLFAKIGLASVKPRSARAVFIGPYAVFTRQAAEYMESVAPGEILNIVCQNDPVTRGPTAGQSVKTALTSVDTVYSKTENEKAYKDYKAVVS
ncbi:hypothetical protein PG997_011780 [Apiospora hydei]|uniref:Fungal lipase-type domain-containing protein n=1 Tax=Apiospora hydei TaxID=1337664 RepID=A0ABR1V1K0_9PEZI